jgi:AAA15 family ATPase/GTPase
MVLKEIRFIRNKGEKNEWRIEGKPDESGIAQPLTLENINLIVGLNASGKSRTVDAIRRIADLVSGEVKLSNLKGMRFDTVQYSLKFEDEKEIINYFIEIKHGKIVQEILEIDGTEKLNRKLELGTLYYESENKDLDF